MWYHPRTIHNFFALDKFTLQRISWGSRFHSNGSLLRTLDWSQQVGTRSWALLSRRRSTRALCGFSLQKQLKLQTNTLEKLANQHGFHSCLVFYPKYSVHFFLLKTVFKTYPISQFDHLDSKSRQNAARMPCCDWLLFATTTFTLPSSSWIILSYCLPQLTELTLARYC